MAIGTLAVGQFESYFGSVTYSNCKVVVDNQVREVVRLDSIEFLRNVSHLRIHLHVEASLDFTPDEHCLSHRVGTRFSHWDYLIHCAVWHLATSIYIFNCIRRELQKLRMISKIVLVKNLKRWRSTDAKTAIVGETPWVHLSRLSESNTKVIATCNLNYRASFDKVISKNRFVRYLGPGVVFEGIRIEERQLNRTVCEVQSRHVQWMLVEIVRLVVLEPELSKLVWTHRVNLSVVWLNHYVVFSECNSWHSGRDA